LSTQATALPETVLAVPLREATGSR
jgi:hypothetical protein